MPISEEVILDRDRVECLVREFSEMLKNEQYYQFKIRIDDQKMTIIPHAKPVEITR